MAPFDEFIARLKIRYSRDPLAQDLLALIEMIPRAPVDNCTITGYQALMDALTPTEEAVLKTFDGLNRATHVRDPD